MEDTIQPNEFLLEKGETTIVEVAIVMSPERLEMLLEQDSNSKIISINKISIVYGDEVSRVRVSRSVYHYTYLIEYKQYCYTFIVIPVNFMCCVYSFTIFTMSNF